MLKNHDAVCIAVSDEFNLAMLLSQLGSENSVRCCIQRQLWQWFNSKADLFIDIDHLKLYTVISGQPLFDSNQGIVNVCEDLDWIRAFALHLWYVLANNVPVYFFNGCRNIISGTSNHHLVQLETH